MRINPRNPDFTDIPIYGENCYSRLCKETTLVTIITAHKNHGNYINENYKSLLSQSICIWEWIIVDDASTDNSLENLRILSEKDFRVKIICNSSSLGPAKARNIGLKQAKGKYTLILDADDLIEPTFIEKALLVLETNQDVAFINAWLVSFGYMNYLWRKGFERAWTMPFHNRVVCTAVFRTDILKSCEGYPEDQGVIHEDWELWLKLLAQGYHGHTIPEFLIWYRRHQKSRVNRINVFQRVIYHLRILFNYPPSLYQFTYWLKNKTRLLPSKRDLYQSFQEYLPMKSLVPQRAGEKEKNILIIVPWFTMGGADKFNLDLARKLKGLYSYRITFVSTLPSSNTWLHEFADVTEDIFNLPLYTRDITLFPAILSYLIKTRNIGKVLVTNSYLGYQMVPWLKEQFPEIGFYSYTHMEEEYWRDGGHPRMAAAVDSYLDKNIVASQHLKEWMLNRKCNPERTEICYINVDEEFWSEDSLKRKEIKQSLQIPEHCKVVILAGRLVDQKRPDLALKIINEVAKNTQQSFIFLVIGNGPLLPKLKKYVNRNKLNDKVRFEGKVNSQRMWEYYQAGDIFFMPSYMEGISLALYEAMATRTVPVGADVGGQKELVTAECGYLIPHGDDEIKKYTEVLISLLESEKELEGRKDKCRKRIEQHFTLNQMVHRMHEILQEPSAEIRPQIGTEFLRMALQLEGSYLGVSTTAKGIMKKIYRKIASFKK